MVPLTFILLTALVASASPGPATLGIATTAMRRGVRPGLMFASGVTLGSLIWSVVAALGLGAVMLTHAWMLELVRYAGASYLLYLAWKAARSALRPSVSQPLDATQSGLRQVFLHGLLLHLTNPKAILFFGALYALILSPAATLSDILLVIGAVGLQSAIVFHGYAMLFSRRAMMQGYLRARRPFEAVFALIFGAAGLKLLTLPLPR